MLQDAVQQHGDRRRHPEHDDEHLLHVGPRHGLHAANGRIGDHRHADREHGDRQRPPERRRHHHRRRGERDAERRRAADHEEEARERARLRVEAPLEILVRGVDARAREERHDGDRQDQHRERQAEVELHEAEAGEIAQAGRAADRHRAQLRGHHRQADGKPRQRAIREEVPVDLVRRLRSPQPVDDDPRDVGDDDEPVERAHENNRPNHTSARMTAASIAITWSVWRVTARPRARRASARRPRARRWRPSATRDRRRARRQTPAPRAPSPPAPARRRFAGPRRNAAG